MLDKLTLKFVLLVRKLRFLMTPRSKRVALDLKTEGRYIPYLILSLHHLGYAIQATDSNIVFYYMYLLRKRTSLPIIFDDSANKCDILITDTIEAAQQRTEPKKILLNYDFFNENHSIKKMHYFMHPKMYFDGLYLTMLKEPKAARPIRVAFYGTRDENFYKEHFFFEMLNREQILKCLFENFDNQIKRIYSLPSQWTSEKIVMAVDDRGGDRTEKLFLPPPDYIKALQKTNFFISPPGWCMPFSHNLIEGMATGSIPILNYSDMLSPRLQHQVNCLAFSSEAELINVINEALTMPENKIQEMRDHVINYYEENLSPGKWLKTLIDSAQSGVIEEVLVNGEEVSMEILKPGVNFKKLPQ